MGKGEAEIQMVAVQLATHFSHRKREAEVMMISHDGG